MSPASLLLHPVHCSNGEGKTDGTAALTVSLADDLAARVDRFDHERPTFQSRFAGLVSRPERVDAGAPVPNWSIPSRCPARVLPLHCTLVVPLFFGRPFLTTSL